jgi:C4-dicarboxylate transporter DctM subunit
MDALYAGGVVTILICLFLGLGVWIFAGLFLVAAASLVVVLGMDVDRVGTIAASISYRYAASWELAAVPMFIWMGEIIFRTNLSDRLFLGLVPFVDKIPGRLLHTNVLGCTLFASVSGSSAATTATVGKITMTELMRRGYDRRLAIGSLAGAGSFGLLIPPSIVMIVYGILAEVSVSRLFAAGVFPGLLMAALFSGWIIVRGLFDPGIAPRGEQHFGPRDYLLAIGNLSPVFILMAMVLGSIYTGIATPSEAAAVGVLGAVILALTTGQVGLTFFQETLLATIRTSCMVCIILVSAAFLSTAMGYLHLPLQIGNAIAALDLGPYTMILLLSVAYLILGIFLDGVAIIVMSLPVTLPLAVGAGFDPVWFGVFLVLMVEIGLLTPPIGINLFVLQGLTSQSLMEVSRSALPFFFLMCLGTLLLVLFPDIALWLPRFLYG